MGRSPAHESRGGHPGQRRQELRGGRGQAGQTGGRRRGVEADALERAAHEGRSRRPWDEVAGWPEHRVPERHRLKHRDLPANRLNGEAPREAADGRRPCAGREHERAGRDRLTGGGAHRDAFRSGVDRDDGVVHAPDAGTGPHRGLHRAEQRDVVHVAVVPMVDRAQRVRHRWLQPGERCGVQPARGARHGAPDASHAARRERHLEHAAPVGQPFRAPTGDGPGHGRP